MSLAARQHGVVARCQLLGAGVAPDLIDHRLRSGRLTRMHRGVYLVGAVTLPITREMGAVLACGTSAVLSRRSAASRWTLLPASGPETPVEVTVIRGRSGQRIEGINVRHQHAVRPDEVTVRDGIPITTPARTLYDLAASADRLLERALDEAIAQRLVSRSKLLSLVGRYAARPGARRLRTLLEGDASVGFTRSEAEQRFLSLVRSATLDAPEVNVRMAGLEVDFLWREQRLVVEVDGHAFHSTPRRFENDRRRDAQLVASGVRVMRVTWHQLVDERDALIVRLTRALMHGAAG
jgi:very-short-patch-repair endonuclease